MNKIVFLDRDGTLNEEKNYLYQPEEFAFTPKAGEAVRLLNEYGYRVIVVTNQAGVARGYYTEADVEKLHKYIDRQLEAYEARIDAYYYCPHHPRYGIGRYKCRCACRKPQTGMFQEAVMQYPADLTHSWMIGDNASDMEAGRAFGLKTILVGTGYGKQIMEEGYTLFDYFKENLYEAVSWLVKNDMEV